MKTIEKVKIGTGIFMFIIVALILHSILPRTVVVQITGTDVKRLDTGSGDVIEKKAGDPKNEKILKTHDVRFINSLSRKGKTMVFRNEDTGWGWPPYLKFNSADLTAMAQAFASDQEKPWVLVKYYGWRLRIFSMFPNAVKLKKVDRDYTHFPLFNIAFFITLVVLALVIRRKIKTFTDWMDERKKPR